MSRQLHIQTKVPTKLYLMSAQTGMLQRKCACGTRTIDGECSGCNTKKGLLPNDSAKESFAGEVPSIVHQVLRSPGRPLDPATRSVFEPRFGHDFSQVRVHADAKAAESAHAVNALAYTMGRDIVFAANQYTPRSFDGKRLLAHELTHVVQQQCTTPANFQIAPPNDAFEQEADSVASGFGVSAVRVQGALAWPALQRQPPPPKEEPEQKPAEKTATSQPPAQKIPALEIWKEYVIPGAASGTETGIKPEAALGTETEIKPAEQGTKAEAGDKFNVELAFPITDKLQVGSLSFLKEASVEGSAGFPAARPYPKPLSNLELQTSLKVFSLEWEKVKVPLGVADFEISGSALGSAGFDVAEGRSEFKAAFAGEAEAKARPGEKSPFFITAKVGVEKTYDKEGNADFKWSPVTWKTFVGTGFKF
jgi:hypothetical protein